MLFIVYCNYRELNLSYKKIKYAVEGIVLFPGHTKTCLQHSDHCYIFIS